MLVMIVIDCIGSYESNYDIITTTTVASEIVNKLKNNQNQTNTTGAQNLKEFNNTAGGDSGFFFGVFFCL
jgi:CheY-specific phosphatase CheX